MTRTATRGAITAMPRPARGAWQVAVASSPAAIGRRWPQIESGGATTLFQTREWLEALYRQAPAIDAEAKNVIVLADDAEGNCALVLPLILRHMSGLRTLSFVDFGVADYNAPLLGPAAPATPAGMRSLWRAIRRVLPAHDLLRLEKVPGKIGERVNPLTWLRGIGRSVLLQSACPISAPYDEARERLYAPRFREKLDSSYRRLCKKADVRFAAAETPEEVETILAALLVQKAKRAETLGWDSILDVPAWQQFYRELALRGLNGGSARLLALWIDGEPLAIILGFMQGTRFHDIVASFEPTKWKNHSLGLMVQDLAMRWTAERGAILYDLTVGLEAYKDDFGPTVETMADYAAAGSPRGWPAAAVARMKGRLRANPKLLAMMRKVTKSA